MADKDRLFREASEFYQQSKFDKAIDTYKKILKIDPENLIVFNMLGDVYVGKNDVENAYELYKKAADAFETQGLLNKAIAVNKKILRIKPEEIKIYEKLLDLYIQLGLIGEANEQYLKIADIYTKEKNITKLLEIYQKIVDLNPKNIKIRIRLIKMYLNENMRNQAASEYIKIAESYKESNSLEEAISFLENAKNELLENNEIKLVLAKFYKENNKNDKALIELQNVFSNDPKNKSTFSELSNFYISLDKKQELISLYENFIKNNPNEIEIQKKLISLYIENCFYEKAEIILKEILSINKQNIELHQQLVEVSLKLNNQKELIQEYEILGELHFKNGQLDNARKNFQKIFDINNENLNAINKLIEICKNKGEENKANFYYLQLAKINEKNNKKELALQDYEKAIQYNPDQPEVIYKIVDIYHDLKKFDKAADLLKIILDKEHDNEQVLEKFGNLLFDAKKNSEAEEAYKKLLIINPKKNKIHERLAEIYIRQDKIEEAIKEIQDILELNPENIDARSRLSELKQKTKNSNKDSYATEIKEVIIEDEKKEPISAGVSEENISFASPQESIINYLDEAKVLISHKQIEKAIELYKKVLSEDIENEEAQYSLKEIAKDRYEKIIEEIISKPKEKKSKKLIEKPSFLDVDEIDEEKALENIISDFKSGVSEFIEEEDFESHYNLGIAYKETGLLDEAIEEFKLAANKEKNVVQCYGLLGICYMEKGVFPLAIKFFILASNQEGFDEVFYRWVKYDLGLAYKKNNEFEKALEILLEVARLDEDYRDVVNEIEQIKKFLKDKPVKMKSKISYI